MIATLLKAVLLFGGITVAGLLLALGVLYLAWIFCQKDNGW